MDHEWDFSDMRHVQPLIPAWQLYGEESIFPDVLHVERIVDRAAGLDWTIEAHRHVHLHQLFLLHSGEIHMTIDGMEWPITLPAVVNVPRGVVHQFAFSAGTEGIVATLPAENFPNLFEPTSETGYALPKAQSYLATESVIARFEELAAIHAQSVPFRRTRLCAAATALVCEMLNCFSGEDLEQLAIDARIQRFSELVQKHMISHLGLERYARELCMSPRNLSRLCRKATGLSARAFVEAQLMLEAWRLLAYTRMTVQQVAYYLGFEDPSYFSRRFRRSVGLSPIAYRNRFDG
jgi:AraC family transcriptional regulator, transcriptional activator of pobA